MATLADLRQRVITETVRDDLADDLASILDMQIASAIDYYANDRFWFNEARATGSMTAGAEYTDQPSGARFIDSFYIVIGGVRYGMSKRSMEELERLYSVPQVGQPTDWASYVQGGQLVARLWPTPNMAYSTIWLTVSDVTPLLDFTDGTSTNQWLTTGYDLITARVKMNLYRDQFRDAEGLASAAQAEKEAMLNMKAESNRRISSGRIRASW